MKYHINPKSDKKKLRDKIGKIHLEILKIKHKNFDTCEFCNKKTNRLGRFHVLNVGEHPRLEYIDKNIILSGWYCCHFKHHHYGSYNPKTKYIEDRLIELLGPNYRDELLIIEKGMPVMSMFYLECLYHSMANELKNLQIMKGLS